MTRLADVRPCPNCAATVVPVSMCNACGTTAVRSDLADLGPRVTCGECKAENPTLFVCETCGNRYLFEEVAGPQKEKFACALCGTFVEADATSCPACGAVFSEEHRAPVRRRERPKRRARGEYSEADLAEISRIPGVGRQRAEALCRAGLNALWKIKRATDAQLEAVPGIGPRSAKTVRDSLRFMLLIPKRKPKAEVLEEEFACPMCGSVTSLIAEKCHDCGAPFDEEELDEPLRAEVSKEPDRSLLAFYDVRLEEHPNDADLWYARALLLRDMGRRPEAMRSIDSAARIDPLSPKIMLARAAILEALDEHGQAASQIRSTLGDLLPAPEAPTPTPEAGEESAALEALAGLAVRECPTCGEPVLPDARVCPACGHTFPAGEPAPVPEEAGEEAAAGLAALEAVAKEAEAEEKAAPRPAPAVAPATEEPTEFSALEDLRRLMEEPPEIPREKPAAERAPARPPRAPPPRIREAPRRPPRPAPSPEIAPPPPPTPRVGLRSPELRVRRGLINGHGLINGSGRVNGLINGNGFIDSGVLTELRLPQRPILLRYALVAGALLMAFAVVGSLVQPPAGPSLAITVDGNPGEWTSLPAYTDPAPAPDPDVNIVRWATFLEGRFLFVLAQVSGQALGDPAEYDAFYVFFDADATPTTGYEVRGLGADYVAEVVGGSGRVDGARLYEFPGDAELNWSRRVPIAGIPAAVSGPSLELRVDTDEFAMFAPDSTRILLAADSFSGAEARVGASVTAIHGAIRIRQVPLAGVVPPGTSDVLRLEVAAVGRIAPGDSWSVGLFAFTATAGLTLSSAPTSVLLTESSTFATVTVSASAAGLPPGSPVEVSLTGAGANRPVTVTGEPLRAYFASIPAGIRIDGLFGDWTGLMVPDTDPAPVGPARMDIAEYGGAANASGTYFSLRVAGLLHEGSLVPQRVLRVPPGPPGGGGPPSAPPPRITGEDIARVYIDANSSDSAGGSIAGIYADYMVEARGANGRITRQTAFRWSNGWVAAPALPLAIVKNATALEGSLGLLPAELNGTRMVFETTDWAGDGDSTDILQTRSEDPGATRGVEDPVPLPEFHEILVPVAGVLGLVLLARRRLRSARPR